MLFIEAKWKYRLNELYNTTQFYLRPASNNQRGLLSGKFDFSRLICKNLFDFIVTGFFNV